MALRYGSSPGSAPTQDERFDSVPKVALSEPRLERVEQGRLAQKDLLAGFGESEPCSPVDLGEGLEVAAPGRPFGLEHVARDRVRVEIAFERIGLDPLAAL